jgi:EAL domain-containing protein (putative c-di-GMP-specific phosphodiesterase class I)
VAGIAPQSLIVAGLETERQLELARQAGIRFGQGNAVRPSFAPPDTRERKRDSRVREVPSPPTLSPFT